MIYKGKQVTWKRYRELQKAKTIAPIDRYQQQVVKMYEPALKNLLRRLSIND